MNRVFVVTALEWDGDWLLRAQVGEADVGEPSAGPSWKTRPVSRSLEELMELIETPDTLVTSKSRSGTAGPTLRVFTDAQGRRTVQAVPIPDVWQDLRDVSSIFR